MNSAGYSPSCSEEKRRRNAQTLQPILVAGSVKLIQFLNKCKWIGTTEFKIWKFCNKSEKLISLFANSIGYCFPNFPMNSKWLNIPCETIAPIRTDCRKDSARVWAGFQRIREFVFPSSGYDDDDEDDFGSGLLIKTISPLFAGSVCCSFVLTNRIKQQILPSCDANCCSQHELSSLFRGVKSSCFRFGFVPYSIGYSVSCTWTTMSLCGCCMTFCFTMQRSDSVVRAYAISSTRLYANKTVFFSSSSFLAFSHFMWQCTSQ